MQIGEPLRTIVVEPLELPVNDPQTHPDPEPAPQPEPEPEQVPSDESAGLHFASCRLSRVVLGRRWGEVVLRGAVASESVTRGDMQKTRHGCGASFSRSAEDELHLRHLRSQERRGSSNGWLHRVRHTRRSLSLGHRRGA